MSKKTAFVDLINDNRIIMPACLRMAATVVAIEAISGNGDMIMTDLFNELAAKRVAIRQARASTKPAVPADQVLVILKADLAKVQAAIDATT
ncbi:hypothetical protein CFR75_14695 [Komagataeibacter xylinus]|uniref:Uncharacterized protein n=1 Tax=Komagataeibacter xylinus TaxID=28448 RepID=A0A318PEY2_KOMXY|nr:hypothetical protein [Komagataeibacter xylinus]PYD55760.1 hypothetical protein CFR75_14695 [Komagataeibacter xylinus]GBQ69093.1 hypothetical protein AA15237_0536 [Komagataeibacter xylinus NBRC 15237]